MGKLPAPATWNAVARKESFARAIKDARAFPAHLSKFFPKKRAAIKLAAPRIWVPHPCRVLCDRPALSGVEGVGILSFVDL